MHVAPVPRDLEEGLPPQQPAPAPAAPAMQMAAAEPRILPELEYMLGAYLAVVVAALLGWWIAEEWGHDPFTPAAGISIFALLYIFAQALERLLEPFARFVGAEAPDVTGEADGPERVDNREAVKQRVDKREAVKQRNLSLEARHAENAAKWQAAIDLVRANAAVALWAAASVLAILASAWLGIRLLTLVGVSEPHVFVDVLVTGLVIGAGTKPLHDLIKNIEKSKQKKEDPPETGGST